MPRYGFSGDKTDMKKLVLFVMKALPDCVTEGDLLHLVLLDDNANYFVFTEALHELTEAGQLLRGHDGRLSLSPEGHNMAFIVEHDISAALRRVSQEKAMAFAEQKRRDDCILCRTEETGGALYFVGEFTDGTVPLFSVRLLVGSREQAHLLTRSFRRKAETLYQANLDWLTNEN